jgi:hypothetical protein
MKVNLINFTPFIALKPEKFTKFIFQRADLKMMSQKRVKRTIEWTIENFTREKIGNTDFKLISNIFILKLGDNITKW